MKNSILLLGRRRTLVRCLAAAVWAVCPLGALAQQFPGKPIRLLVGIAPGGGLDAAARMVARKLAQLLGQPVVVENRAGAGGTIAASAVASAEPDGYTLLYAASTLLISPSVVKTLPFDPIKSFTAIGGVGADPLMIVVNEGVPARTTAEFLTLLKANPGKYSYGSTGIGSMQHLSMELFKKQAGVNIVHVPYKGAAQVLPDLMSGVLQIAMISAASGVPHIKSGKLRAIAHTRPGKLPIAPEVPSIADLLPGFDTASAQFIVAPARTPSDVVATLSQALKIALASEEMAAFFQKQGAILEFVDPPTLAARMQAEVPQWQAIAKAAGVVPE